MKITLKHIAKRYRQEWIFKDIDQVFLSGNSYAITGNNGSGKSTLIKIISGQLLPTAGKVMYESVNQIVPEEKIFTKVSLVAPYLELMEEFSLKEQLNFQQNFKPFIQAFSPTDIIDLCGLHSSADKKLKNFSSGMMQRVKLVLAVLADVPVVLLDEPTVNLDKKGVEWYHQLIREYSENRLFIVSSNQEYEYQFCEHKIELNP